MAKKSDTETSKPEAPATEAAAEKSAEQILKEKQDAQIAEFNGKRKPGDPVAFTVDGERKDGKLKHPAQLQQGNVYFWIHGQTRPIPVESVITE